MRQFLCFISVVLSHYSATFPSSKDNRDIFMALYGYARVSSNDQDLTLQTQMLRAAGCEIIQSEKASGTQRNG